MADLFTNIINATEGDISNAASAVGTAVKTAASGVSNYATNVGKAATQEVQAGKSYFTNLGKETTAAVTAGKQEASEAPEIPQLFTNIAQGMADFPVSLLADETGKSITPSGPIGTAILGNNPIQPLSQTILGNAASVKGATGLPVGAAIPIAAIAGIGGGAFQFSYLGGEEGLADDLLKTSSVEKTYSILQKAGVPEDLIPDYAQSFAKASSKAEVQTGIDSLKNTIENTSSDAGKIPEVNPGVEDANYPGPQGTNIPTEATQPSESEEFISGEKTPPSYTDKAYSHLSNADITPTKNVVDLGIEGESTSERVKSAINNSEYVKNSILSKSKDISRAADRLNLPDKIWASIRDAYQGGMSIPDIAEKYGFSNKKGLQGVLTKIEEYYDFELAADRASGGRTNFEANHLPQYWDLADPADQARFNELATQRGLAPYKGFRSQGKVFQSYAEGISAGFKPQNSNIIEDALQHGRTASNVVGTQALKQGLGQAVPGMLSEAGKGLTDAGKPFINSNIPGIEGLSYHPDVAKLLKGFETKATADIANLLKESGFNPLDPNTYSKGWDALVKNGIVNSSIGAYDATGNAMKTTLLNFSLFHSLNISANVAGAMLFRDPIGFAKGLAESIPSFFSEGLTQKIIDGFTKDSIDFANGVKTSTVDGLAKIGVNSDRGIITSVAQKYNPLLASSRAIFDRELYVLKLTFGKQLLESLAKDGYSLGSPEALDMGGQLNRVMGDINPRTMNISPATIQKWGRVLLATNFDLSKVGIMSDAIKAIPKIALGKATPAEILAAQTVLGKSIVLGTLATVGTLAATGKLPSAQQLMADFSYQPGVQTNLTNTKGQKIDIGFPQTFLSEAGTIGSSLLGLFQGSTTQLNNYLMSRLSPALTTAIAAYGNKDYYGNPIVNPNKATPAWQQVMQNLGTTLAPIGVQALIDLKEGKMTAQQAAITILGLKTRVNANDPTIQGYNQEDSAQTQISKIAPDDPNRLEKMQAIFNSVTPDQAKSLASRELLAGVSTKGIYTSDTERKYFQVQQLMKQGDQTDAAAITKAMTPAQYKDYQSIKTRLANDTLFNQVKTLVQQGNIDGAKSLTQGMTKDQYKSYQTWKKSNP